MYSKGFAAEETKAAFARATELAANSEDFSERFAAAHGQWTSALVRGELRSARELASAFLQEAESLGRFVEFGVVSRGLAIISYGLGEFAEARPIASGRSKPATPSAIGRRANASARTPARRRCPGLAVTMWQLGEVERARELIEAVNRRAAEGSATLRRWPIRSNCQILQLEMQRGDAAAAPAAAEPTRGSRARAWDGAFSPRAELFVGWARGRLPDPAAGRQNFGRLWRPSPSRVR